MNINDVDEKAVAQGDMLVAIFGKQRELMEKYKDIEGDNSFLKDATIPVNIDDCKGQALLKDFFWRITEEMAEAMEAYGNREHLQEELADALHFFVEMMILAGVNPEEFTTSGNKDRLQVLFEENANAKFYGTMENLANAVISLGLAANCLKNKPWKQTQMKTDKVKFYNCLTEAFERFIGLCIRAGFNSQSLYEVYFKKNKVNQFRQESKY